MTPKAKAKDIYKKQYKLAKNIKWSYNNIIYKLDPIIDGENTLTYWRQLAKQTALIVVKEIVKSKELDYLFTKEEIKLMECTSDDRWIHETFVKYWKQVKREIQNL